jgi:transcriptional regulator with XRE-family HTH domain
MNADEIVGQNLKRYREKMGLTQELTAGFLAITREELSYYETGKRLFPTKLMTKAARLFGIDEYDLVEASAEAAEVKVALAFRADTFTAGDLHHIADFRKIVLNYLQMQTALKNESAGA